MLSLTKSRFAGITLLKTLFFFLLAAQICFGQWVFYQPLTDLNQNDVSYAGPNQIFIVCDQGVVLQTRNSGATWSQLQLTNNSDLNKLFFLDEYVGFIAGDEGRIFKTEDCWNNWIDLSIDFYFHIKDIAFLDYDNGVAVGSKEVRIDGRTYFLPTIHTTTDAGLNWVEKHFNIYGRLNSVSYLADGILLAVGDSGMVFRSTDYGSTWNSESVNVLTNLNLVRICPEYITIITGDGGTFLYSFDLGESWQSIDLPFYYHIKGACYNTSGEIIVACSKEVRVDGRTFYMATIIRLDPISNQWTEEFSTIRGKYNSVSFCEPEIVIAVGDSGLIAIYESVSYADNAAPLFDFALLQNYPNPFNPSTVISWQSPVGSHQTLEVYDVLGNEVVTLVDEYKPAGRYEVEFGIHSGEGRKLSSGVYFYQFRAGEIISTKKMVLLK